MVWLCFIHINYRHNAYIIIYYALCCLDNNMTMATDCTRDMHQDGLILPRKPVNPCLTSNEHQNLHRELLFNQKMYDFFFSIPYKKTIIIEFLIFVITYIYIFFYIFDIFLQREERFGTKVRVTKGAGETQAFANSERNRTTEKLLPHAIRKDDWRTSQKNRNGT